VLNYGHNHSKMKERLVEYIQSNGVVYSLGMYTAVKRDFISKSVEGILKPRDRD